VGARPYAGVVEDARTLVAAAVTGASLGTAVGFRAASLGHEISVRRVGKRFTIVCPCGWSTPANWTRRHAMTAAVQHAYDAVGSGVSVPAPADPRL
jgi:hypothetical protein